LEAIMSTSTKEKDHENRFSRKNFLRLTGVAAAGLLVEGCKSSETSKQQVKASSGVKPGQYQVAIGKASTYDRDVVDAAVMDLINRLGGLGDIVKPGSKVAIKPNLTGGVTSALVPGYTAIESFITHPEVVRALIRMVQVAGATDITIVESVYEWESYTAWGYEQVAKDMGVKLVDLNDVKPYDDYVDAKVENSFIYPSFRVNKILQDVDVFMSVSKMKNHYNAGVTHTMKNLYGLAPVKFNTLNPGDSYRSAFHGLADQTRTRLPRVIIDINRIRPIHFSLIDGIMTAEAGEGPWIETMTPVQPGVLLAGKNCVATDAVATAVMGHNPTADYPSEPFIRCDNHLNLAAAAGLGTNKLEEIEVLGVSIDKAKYQFTPAR
jgi:uncharacterized protein (DUF362 family)